ncbi:ATP-binding protein [Rothia kristinae]|uniref:ATP-binding protein n=1 Tax=Rothia kristinae TaxID=37923 RepID=UPI0011A43A7D|nr:ATP-binding protein [Rothia kristinae]
MFKRKDTVMGPAKKQKGPAIIPPARQVRRGFKGRYGGAWGGVATPRMWMETNQDHAGMYPFIAGTNRPRRGAPIGYDLGTGSAVAMDHLSLFRARAITAPAAMMFGLNGFGKSSISALVAGAVNACGTPLAIFDPIKGEYTELAEAMGADVFQLGPKNGRQKVNPMDPGPLAAAGAKIGGQAGQDMQADGIKNVVANVSALLRINRGRDKPVSDSERTMVRLAVQEVMSKNTRPGLGDLLAFFDQPSERAVYAAGLRSDESEQFKETYRPLFQSISALVYGELSEIFDDKGLSINPGNPAGFCFDSSAIPSADDKMISATMMSTWRLGMDAIDAHWELAQHEARKAAEAAEAGEQYTPEVTWNGYSSLMDEFWFPVRMADGMVHEVDRLSRTNRSVGVGEWKITHSPKDFEMIANEADREIAKSLIERCGLWVMLAMTPADMEALNRIRPIESTEKAWVTSFMSGSQGLENYQDMKKTRRGLSDSSSQDAPPPGVGKALWKVGDSLGIPVKSPKPPTLGKLHQTSQRLETGQG